MKVSFNELQGLSRKAFIAIGFDEGDANDAADMVAWMEAHGLNGVTALRKGLDFLLNEDKTHPPKLIYQDADLCVVDAENKTVLGHASLAIELGYAKCRARGLSVTKIRHCHNRMLIVGYLSRIARRGMSVTAFWRNSHEPLTEIIVSFKSGEAEPEICMYELPSIPDDIEPNNGITLVMVNHVDLLPDLKPDAPANDLIMQNRAAMLDWHERSLVDGIEVDPELCERLKLLATKMLVESSEDSRQGAGAGTNDND
jgi:LDH2 family malate/lactate/ureidoglycolate dehydrogenase